MIYIPLGCTNFQMLTLWRALNSLMIRVNTANSLRFYRRAGRNNTIAKIQPIWEKKQQETALNGPECTAPWGATSITVTRPKRRTLEEVIAKMEMAAYVYVSVWQRESGGVGRGGERERVPVRVCVSVFSVSVWWVGGGWRERHSVKRSFRNTLPPWRWRELLIDMHFSTETRAINLYLPRIKNGAVLGEGPKW